MLKDFLTRKSRENVCYIPDWIIFAYLIFFSGLSVLLEPLISDKLPLSIFPINILILLLSTFLLIGIFIHDWALKAPLRRLIPFLGCYLAFAAILLFTSGNAYIITLFIVVIISLLPNHYAYLFHKRNFKIIFSCAGLISYIAFSLLQGSRPVATLRHNGKIEYMAGPIWNRRKLDLRLIDKKWCTVNFFGKIEELKTPFSSYYNNNGTKLIFTRDGKLYLVYHSDYTKDELKVVNGEWSFNASDHWQSIFDLAD